MLEKNIYNRSDIALDSYEFYSKYKRKKSVTILTLGCKVNQYETEAMQELFLEDGYEIVENDDKADVYVINTCTVTAMGSKKSRQFIRRVKRINSDAIIVVVGCYSQVSPDEVKRIDGVNLILGTHNRSRIVEYINMMNIDKTIDKVNDIMKVDIFEEMKISSVKDKTRAFLKIQEGCNQYCTYCIIPYARGRIRSRQLYNIKDEVTRLANKGFKEIVLTGIHLGSYGKDIKKHSLIEAIEVTANVDGIERVRIGSLEPKSITDEFLDRVSKIKEFCPHFHLSLQSGCDTVLKRMNRRYTTDEYYESVMKIRKIFPMAAITTDIIVGFPMETDEEFNQTMEFVKKVQFYQIHVFKYSIREGTPAAKMKQVNSNKKDIRSNKLISEAENMEKEYLQRFIGSEIEVLFEKYSNFSAMGHTIHYVSVRVNSPINVSGEIKRVKVIGVEDKVLIAKFI